jgi:hypothetical protein
MITPFIWAEMTGSVFTKMPFERSLVGWAMDDYTYIAFVVLCCVSDCDLQSGCWARNKVPQLTSYHAARLHAATQ